MGIILLILFFGMGVIIVGTVINLFTIWVGWLVLAIIIGAILYCVLVCIEHPKEWIVVGIVAFVLILMVLWIHNIVWIY